MSRYTTQLRFPIEQRLDDLGYNHKESNWRYVWALLGLDDYPIYDESHRAELNAKIVRRYYFREIGFETMGQFRWHVREHMHSVMPYYNQLYPTVGMVTDPLSQIDRNWDETWTRDEDIDRDGSTTGERTAEGTTTSTVDQDRRGTSESAGRTDVTTDSTGTTSDRNVFQDTPMNGLDTGAIEGMDYATNVTFDNGTDTSHQTQGTTTSTSGSTTEATDTATEGTSYESSRESGTSSSHEKGDYDGTHTHREKGRTKSESDLMLTYRKTIINIDREIVDGLDELFMGLW